METETLLPSGHEMEVDRGEHDVRISSTPDLRYCGDSTFEEDEYGRHSHHVK